MSPLPRPGDAEQFVRDTAVRGCGVTWPEGGSCLERLESARVADGVQSPTGPHWELEGEGGAYRERVVAGEELCRGCRAQAVLTGAYYPPGPKDWTA